MFEWQTKAEDIKIAKELLLRHCTDEQETEVGLQEVRLVEDGGVWITRADWVIELEEFFEARYGEVEGNLVTKRVVTALLTQGERVH